MLPAAAGTTRSLLQLNLLYVVVEGGDDPSEVLGQQTLIPAPLCFPRTCFKGLTCALFPLPSVSLPHHRDIIRNCAVSVDQIQDLHSPMSPISENPASPAYSTGRHCPSIPVETVGLWINLDLALL